jgi:hypothetical protein
MRSTIKTVAPKKGDLVAGHKVYAFFPKLPAVPGKIVAVSESGHSVTFEVGAVLAVMGLPRCTEWTWRKSVNAYQQKGSRTERGGGLALVTK